MLPYNVGKTTQCTIQAIKAILSFVNKVFKSVIKII